MFQRIKNLLDISRYTVEELKTEKTIVKDNIVYKTTNPYIKETKRPQLSSSPATQYAKIVEIKTNSPLDEFNYGTTQQPLDDTTPRNG